MKRTLIVALTLVALSFLTVSTSFAQDKVRADVPFAFQVGKASLPAGTYTVSKVADHSLVIRNSKQVSEAALANYGSDERSKIQSPKMIFHQYGNSYFLAEIWDGTGNIGMKLPESKHEKEMQATNWSPADSGIVIVAMK